MVTLKQRLEKKACGVWEHFLTPEDAKLCVKEWLQQKHHKKISFVEDVENKFIDELLEELEQNG